MYVYNTDVGMYTNTMQMYVYNIFIQDASAIRNKVFVTLENNCYYYTHIKGNKITCV